jgi:hypothetical protein
MSIRNFSGHNFFDGLNLLSIKKQIIIYRIRIWYNLLSTSMTSMNIIRHSLVNFLYSIHTRYPMCI